eukprot:9500854-Pyramimonas_sp.AAC.1
MSFGTSWKCGSSRAPPAHLRAPNLTRHPRLQGQCDEVVAPGACLGSAAVPRRRQRRNSAGVKYLVKSAFCSGLWTEDRARASGYLCLGLCPLCQQPDSVGNRLFQCSTRTWLRRARRQELPIISAVKPAGISGYL